MTATCREHRAPRRVGNRKSATTSDILVAFGGAEPARSAPRPKREIIARAGGGRIAIGRGTGKQRDGGSRVRCGGGRRGVRRDVHAASAARHGARRAGARGGRRGRRDLVLEPLPGGALRRREHGVLLPVLGRAAAGMGVERALRGAARDPALRQPRRRPLRPAPGHPARHPGEAADFDEAAGRWRIGTADGAEVGATLLHHGDRLPVGAQPAAASRASSGSGADLPHRRLAAGGRRLHGPAGRGDRHRLVGGAVDPADRRAGRHLFVFQRTPNYVVPARNAPLDPVVQARVKADYAALRRRPSRGGPASSTRSTRCRPRRRARRSASASTRRAGTRAGSASSARSSTSWSTAGATTPRPSSSAPRSGPSCATRRWRRRSRRRASSAASACASTPATTRPSTARTSRWSTSAARRSRRSPSRASGPAAGTTRSTRWCSRPASTR